MFILLGAEVPIVLRKEDGVEYSFVGKCFVHGLMKGEGLRRARKVADPNCDFDDHTAWLKRLRKGEVPSPLEEVTIR